MNQVILSCGRLRATVLTPDSNNYRRSRFVRAGMISEVKLGEISFTQAERDQPGSKSTGGMGLCCEYKCPNMEETVAVGEQWLKPGVGILRRENVPWSHLSEAEVEPLPNEWSADRDRISMTTWGGPLHGIAYRESRYILVEENEILLKVILWNTGDVPLQLLDYCHNFVSLGSQPLDDNQHLLLPCVNNPSLIKPEDTLRPTVDGVTWERTPTRAFFRPFLPTHSEKTSWILYQKDGALSILEKDSFAPQWLTLWGDRYCICPEVYQRISIRPGHWTKWTRRWRFEG